MAECVKCNRPLDPDEIENSRREGTSRCNSCWCDQFERTQVALATAKIKRQQDQLQRIADRCKAEKSPVALAGLAADVLAIIEEKPCHACGKQTPINHAKEGADV